MLDIPEKEFFDDETACFIKTKKEHLQLEHSLVSLSKWESKWCKPFISKNEKTTEELLDYIRCMTINQNVNPNTYNHLTPDLITEIVDYINAKMTATWFNNKEAKRNQEVITAEIIYYRMIAQNIPMECQKWHLNRLLTLIQVCDIKNQPPKKQGRKETLNSRAALNRARRAQHQSNG